jgi:hypothetical protein
MSAHSELIDLNAHFEAIIEAFKPLSFPKGFGFDVFTTDDFTAFLSDDNQFEFSLKKAKGAHILYGLVHAQVRRQLFNGLSKELRLSVFRKKAEAFKLFDKLGFIPDEIQDCWDIGMGHSVYAVTLPAKTIVIKQEELPNQSLFCLLLTALGWPSFESFHVDSKGIGWEISDYLGPVSLCDVLQAQPDLRQDIEDQLAKHAALGDILGRGDRHYDNYMMTPKGLVPIDISFLFWEGNEAWDYKYIAGGIYEFNVLRRYTGSRLDEKKGRFFNIYKDTLLELKRAQPLLESHISTFLGQFDLEAEAKLDFIRKRLDNIDAYFQSQVKLYEEGFTEMQRRERLKRCLEEWVKEDPTCLEKNPVLKMYALADFNRPSCFFLLEEYPEIEASLKSRCQ